MSGNVTVTGAKAARARVAGVGKRGSDIRDSSSKVRTVYRKAQMAKFDTSGHGSWPSLADSTLERKRAQHLPPVPLRATDALYKSLTAPRANAQVDERRASELVFGTTLPYARFHNVGKGVPRRALMEFTTSEQHAMAKAIESYVAEGKTR